MKKPKLGQTLYSLNVGNAARNTPQKLTPMIVTKVGRKYFTLGEGYASVQFHLSDWRENSSYSPNHRLYESEEDYENEKEKGEISQMICDSFQYGRNNKDLSLDSLRSIAKILEESSQ